MLRRQPSAFDSVLRAADAVLAAAVFALLASRPAVLSSDVSTTDLVLLGIVASSLWPLALRYARLYQNRSRMPLRAQLLRLALWSGVVGVGLAGAAFALGATVPRSFPFACAGAQLGGLAALRILSVGLWRWLNRKGREPSNVLIVGSGPRAEYVCGIIEQNTTWGLSVIGFVDAGEPPGGPSVSRQQIYKLADMQALLYEHVIDEVIVACPRSMLQEVVCVVDVCAAAGVPLTLLSDLFGDYLPTPRVERFGTLPALSFAPVHHNALLLAVKRGIDLVVSSIGLLVSAPLLGLAALAIKLTSEGPVLFRQTRCTRNGRSFQMLKLRTMHADAEERRAELEALNEMDGPVFKMRDDPRITPVGRILRRLSIDELPQLWNVLRGDMSLVGPRPPIPSEVMDYRTFERRRLSMRPGITCIWQISGRNEVGFDDWVRMDLEYIDTWSLGSDLRILLNTVPAVLGGTGAS